MMTCVSEGGIPVLLSLGIIFLFVLVMVGLASYVFTREVNKPFWEKFATPAKFYCIFLIL